MPTAVNLSVAEEREDRVVFRFMFAFWDNKGMGWTL